MTPLVVYVAYEHPPRSQTFVYNEALELQATGLDVCVFAINYSVGGAAGVRVFSGRFRLHRNDLRLAFLVLRNAVRECGVIAKLLTLPPRNVRQFARSCKALLLAGSLAIQVLRVAENNRRVHLHGHFFGLMSEVALLGRCFIGRSASSSIMGHAGDVANPRSADRIRYEAHVADFVACASRFVQSNLLETDQSISSVVVHCGLPPDFLGGAPLVENSEVLRIVTVARLVEKKGLDDLISAVAKLSSVCVELRLVIGGTGPLQRLLSDKAESLSVGHLVELRGALAAADVRKLLTEEADVFALPCKVGKDGDSDGIPVALMEAMAAGVPVVTTEVGGIGELVQHDVSGYLVAPGDYEALADWLVVAGRRNRRVILAAQRKISEEFNLTTEVRKLRDEILGLPNARDPI